MSLLYGFARRSGARRSRSPARRSRAAPRRRSPSYYRKRQLEIAAMPANPCHGLSEYQCGSNPNCSFDTNPWTKTKFCKRRKGAAMGEVYMGPMNNPSPSVASSQDAAAIKKEATEYSAKVAAMGASAPQAADAVKNAVRSRRVKKALKRSKKMSKKASKKAKRSKKASKKAKRSKRSKKASKRSKRSKRSRRH